MFAQIKTLLLALLAVVKAQPSPAPAVTAYVASVIRTVAPAVAGWVLVHVPLVADHLGSATAQAYAVFALGFAWYVAVRALEQVWPVLSWLLGAPVQPAYPAFTARKACCK